MTSPAITIPPYESVAEAARIMCERGVNRLPVVKDERLVGIITRADLVRAFTRSDEEIAREIREDVLAADHVDRHGQGRDQRAGRSCSTDRSAHTRSDVEPAQPPGAPRSRCDLRSSRPSPGTSTTPRARASVRWSSRSDEPAGSRLRDRAGETGASRPGTAGTRSCTRLPASRSASTSSSRPSPTRSNRMRTTRSTSSSKARRPERRGRRRFRS